MSTVLCRMLIAPEERNWEQEQNAVLNILGTRVQLGETVAEIVTTLATHGFANVSGCSEDCNTLKLIYLPDPVCARLAMCMMDEDFTHRPIPGWKRTIQGKKKQWWTLKMKEMFCKGIVRSAKGDFGEVVVALYMLFCGDLLRKKISDKAKSENKDSLDYSHISVPLNEWLDLLLSGGKANEGEALANVDLEECPSVSVGFIQVCRNSLRSYEASWATLGDQSFLKRIFESGVAFYVAEGCDLIDMVVPLRINREHAEGDCCLTRPEYEFVPMLVSIKCQWSFSQSMAEEVCHAMTTRADTSGLNKALCLLIVFGSNPDYTQFTGDIALVHAAGPVSQLVKTRGIVSKAVRVPGKDVFGLTDAFRDMTPDSQVNSELYSAHSFLMAHGDVTHEDLNAENAMCVSSSTAWKDKYNDLRAAMISPVARADTKQSISDQG